MKASIGIDVGTTSICGVAVSAAGELVASVEYPNDSALNNLPPGRSEQDPQKIYSRVLEVLKDLQKRVDEPACIGLTGQMHGMLCVDAKNRPQSPLINWQDGRCLEQTPDGETWIQQMLNRAGQQAWQPCGCQPAGGFMGSTLYWLTRKNALPANTARVTFIHDWIAGLLIDQLPVTDPSNAGSAGIFDLAQLRWHEQLIKDLDLPGDLLPSVHESGEVIGTLSEAMARETDLPVGLPICNAIGDNQASVLGAVADVDRTLLLNLGTGGQISWAVPEFIRVPEMETRYLPCNRYMLVGASLCGGGAFAWLNDVVTSWLRTFNIQVDREETYEKMVKLASMAPSGANGLNARTTFAGKRTDPNLRGAIENISLGNFTLDNVARAVLEGIVEELCAYYNAAGDKAAGRHENVVASGNAVRKNTLLREIIGRRLNMPVLVPCHREEAAGGAALLAGVTVGLWPDLDHAGKCVQYLPIDAHNE